MLEELLDKGLTINCGLACMLKDRAGVLDKYKKIVLNCGTLIMSSEISAKLAEKGSVINSGNSHVQDVKGEIIELKNDYIADGTESFTDMFVVAKGDVIVRGDGLKSFADTEGVVVVKTLYYPESSSLEGLSKIKGKTRAYPESAHLVTRGQKLEQLIGNIPAGTSHAWVAGKVTALDRQAFADAKAMGLHITCDSLFTYEGLNSEYGELFSTSQKELAPNGYEVIMDNMRLSSAEVALYGTKIYVTGDLTLTEKDAACLEELEDIIVKGQASLPASCVKAFRKIGKAAKYFIYEGHLRKINGFEQFTHAQMQTMLASGTKITLKVNGCLMFADDVTAEDIGALAVLDYNGSVLAPGAALGALSAKVGKANGFMGDVSEMQKLTGLSLEELKRQVTGGGGGGSTINTGEYFLV